MTALANIMSSSSRTCSVLVRVPFSIFFLIVDRSTGLREATKIRKGPKTSQNGKILLFDQLAISRSDTVLDRLQKQTGVAMSGGHVPNVQDHLLPLTIRLVVGERSRNR